MKLKKIFLLGIFAVLTAACLAPGLALADDDSTDESTKEIPISASDFKDGCRHIGAATEPTTYYLTEDIDNGAIRLTGDTKGTLVTIDLRGHTLKQTEEIFYNDKDKVLGTIYLFAKDGYKVNVRIINSVPESGGIVQDYKSRNAIYLDAEDGAQAPTLTLDGVNVSSCSATCMAIKCGEVTVNNSSLAMVGTDSRNGAIYVKSSTSKNKLTVNSGSLVASTMEKPYDIISSENNVTSNDLAVTLNGGTYNQVPELANLGEGKYICQTNTGEYTVGDNHDGYDYAVVPSYLGGVWFKTSEEALAYKNSFSKKSFHTVTFVSSNKVQVPDQYVADRCKVAQPVDPSDPSYEGLTFESWQIDGTDYDFSSKLSSDLTLVAKYSGNVASVDGTTYGTLQEAINAANDGQTVKLIRSTLENVALDASKNITVDLDGNVLLNKDTESSTFTIKNGHVNLQNGMVKYKASDEAVNESNFAISIEGSNASADLNVNASSDSYTAVYVDYSASATINDGNYVSTFGKTAEGVEPGVLTLGDYSTVTIEGGTFSSPEGVSSIVSYRGSTSINSGSFSSDLKNGNSYASWSLQGGQYAVMPNLDSVTDGYVLYKPVDPDDPDDLNKKTSPYSVVNSDADLVKNAPAKVEISGKAVYYESATEAKAYALAHKDEGAVATIYVSAEITAPKDAVYDGEPKEATVSFSGTDVDVEADDLSAVIEYTKDGEKLAGAPVNAGSYTATMAGLSNDDKEYYKYVLRSDAEITDAFVIAKADAGIALATGETLEKLLNDESFSLGATKATTADLTYESSNEEVAEVDSEGTVSIKAVGEATLTVSTVEAENFNAGKKEVRLTVVVDSSNIALAKVELEQNSYTYNGKQQQPAIKSVVLGDAKLVEGTDFTLSYGENINAGTKAGTVTLTGIGSYTGSKTLEFDIQKAKATIQVKEPGEKTVDESFNLGATVTIDSGIEGEKPALAYESSNKGVASVDENGQVKAVAEGTATLTVKIAENGNFTADSRQVSLTVKAAPSPSPEPTPAPTPVVTDLSAAKVTLSKTAFTYNGKAQKPSVKSVVLNGKTLKSGTDYTASIASGKKVGTYKVTITAKGSSYKGKTTASFVVNPKGVSKFKVSKAKKAFKAKWTKNKTERSGVQIRYSTKKSMAGAKTVKAKGASVKAKTVKKLKKKTKYYVQARSYKVVNGKTYYSSWSAKKTVKTK